MSFSDLYGQRGTRIVQGRGAAATAKRHEMIPRNDKREEKPRAPSSVPESADQVTSPPPTKREAHDPKGVGAAREKLSDVNPTDTGERGPTGPAAL